MDSFAVYIAFTVRLYCYFMTSSSIFMLMWSRFDGCTRIIYICTQCKLWANSGHWKSTGSLMGKLTCAIVQFICCVKIQYGLIHIHAMRDKYPEMKSKITIHTLVFLLLFDSFSYFFFSNLQLILLFQFVRWFYRFSFGTQNITLRSQHLSCVQLIDTR